MKKIVFVSGLTATGKTDLAVKLAKKFNGELINADSRQIYKFLDIGTNKGVINIKDGTNFINDIPIYLLSFLNPDERYSVFNFKVDAINYIEEILAKGKLPIIVGGTGLYIDSIIRNYSLSEQTDFSLRQDLETKSLEQLQEILTDKYKTAFDKLNQSDRANKRRLVRLIEKLSNPKTEVADNGISYEYLMLYKNYDWEELTKKIDDRVEQMFKDGLVEETQKVLELGFAKDSIALQGIGYKEVIQYLEGKIDLQKCIEVVKIAHRQYAKRQRTWFEGTGRNYKLIKVTNLTQAANKLKLL